MRGFVGWTELGFAGQIRRWKTQPLCSRTDFDLADLQANPGFVASAKSANLNCGLLHYFRSLHPNGTGP